MLSTIAFLLLSAFTIWLLRYAYTLEVKLDDTEDALSRCRSQLASEKEYVDRLEKKVLALHAK